MLPILSCLLVPLWDRFPQGCHMDIHPSLVPRRSFCLSGPLIYSPVVSTNVKLPQRCLLAGQAFGGRRLLVWRLVPRFLYLLWSLLQSLSRIELTCLKEQGQQQRFRIWFDFNLIEYIYRFVWIKTCLFIWGEIEGVYIVEGKGILGLRNLEEVLG